MGETAAQPGYGGRAQRPLLVTATEKKGAGPGCAGGRGREGPGAPFPFLGLTLASGGGGAGKGGPPSFSRPWSVGVVPCLCLGSQGRPGGSGSPISERFSAVRDGCGSLSPTHRRGSCLSLRLLSSSSLRPFFLLSVSLLAYFLLDLWQPRFFPDISGECSFSKPRRALALCLTPLGGLSGEGKCTAGPQLPGTTTSPVR